MKYSQLIFLLKLQLLAIMKLYKTRLHACSFLFIYLFFYKQSDTARTCLVKKKKKTNRLILASFWLFCLFLWISANTGRNKRFGQHALSDLEQWNQIICRKKKKTEKKTKKKAQIQVCTSWWTKQCYQLCLCNFWRDKVELLWGLEMKKRSESMWVVGGSGAS